MVITQCHACCQLLSSQRFRRQSAPPCRHGRPDPPHRPSIYVPSETVKKTRDGGRAINLPPVTTEAVQIPRSHLTELSGYRSQRCPKVGSGRKFYIYNFFCLLIYIYRSCHVYTRHYIFGYKFNNTEDIPKRKLRFPAHRISWVID